MNKEFVPYEQALALKELGFDEPCFCIYNREKVLRFNNLNNPNDRNKSVKLTFNNGRYPAPTFSQAFRFFREKYQLYQAVYADKRADDLTLLYKVHVYKLDEELSEYAYRWAKTYEEAEQACLDKLIKLVKEKK